MFHAFQWRNGVRINLGSLGDSQSSLANWVNASGDVAGLSENGVLDPVAGVPEIRAVLWKNDRIIDLGTLGGTESDAIGMNDHDQVNGIAENNVPDHTAFLGPDFGTQTRAFLWERGVMRDLGTLGGPDAFAQYINNRGQIFGFSFTDSFSIDPFLWENGHMKDLGSFGGTFGQFGFINSRGQAVGESNLPGDASGHPFLWDGRRLIDLGTFGGFFGNAKLINERGDAVGFAYLPDDETGHAALWKNRKIRDLGVSAGDRCSDALSINSKDQIVGTSWTQEGLCIYPDPTITAQHAVLWERGSTIDLNTRIAANAGLYLVWAAEINDRGEIAGIGVPPGVALEDYETLGHAFLLVPCSDGDCGNAAELTRRASVIDASPGAAKPRNTILSNIEKMERLGHGGSSGYKGQQKAGQK